MLEKIWYFVISYKLKRYILVKKLYKFAKEWLLPNSYMSLCAISSATGSKTWLVPVNAFAILNPFKTRVKMW
jgi:hypothetical protein